MSRQSDVSLAEWSTLGVGGPARWFTQVRDEATIVDALRWAREQGLPVHVLGGGSNVVFADEGFNGLVIQIDIRGVSTRAEDGRVVFRAGAGEPWDPFVASTIDENCAGLECLSGIPGQVGGTPVQNVGAYGQDVSGSITRVRVVDRSNHTMFDLLREQCGFDYRVSRFKRKDIDRFIITCVDFALPRHGAPTLAYPDVVAFFRDANNSSPSLAEVRDAILTIRRRKGMVIEDGNAANRSVGSFFVNPVIPREEFIRIAAARDDDIPHFPVGERGVKIPAAWLIERSGFTKGSVRGRVRVSPFQAQAIINSGGASAHDVVALAADIKHAVWENFGVTLVPEPVFVGFPPSPTMRWLLTPDARCGRPPKLAISEPLIPDPLTPDP